MATDTSFTPGCMQYNYTCAVRNFAVFQDTLQHIFGLSATGTMMTAGSMAMGAVGVSAPYTATTQPWYNQLNMPGWSAAPVGPAETYSVPFAGGVAGAMRMLLEPCTVCMQNMLNAVASSYLGHQATAAATAMLNYGAVTTFAGLQAPAQALVNIALAHTMPGQMLQDLYVGWNATQDSYLVLDCRRATSPCQNNSNPYGVWIRNEAVFGDVYRRELGVTAAGLVVMQVLAKAATPYYTSLRPWFGVGYGWTDVYGSFTLNAQVRTLAVPLAGNIGRPASAYGRRSTRSAARHTRRPWPSVAARRTLLLLRLPRPPSAPRPPRWWRSPCRPPRPSPRLLRSAPACLRPRQVLTM